jgi:hypothetical protein
MGKYKNLNLKGNWHEKDLQNAIRTVQTNELSTNAVAIQHSENFSQSTNNSKQTKSKSGRKSIHARKGTHPVPENY